MKEFFMNNWISIVIIAALLGYIVYLIINKKWDKLRGLAYRFMLAAEKAVTGTEQGQNRFNIVCIQVYSLLPAWFRIFVPISKVKEKLQTWYIEIADYFDNGKIDGSVNKDFKEVTEKIESTDQAAAQASSQTNTGAAQSITVAQ